MSNEHIKWRRRRKWPTTPATPTPATTKTTTTINIKSSAQLMGLMRKSVILRWWRWPKRTLAPGRWKATYSFVLLAILLASFTHSLLLNGPSHTLVEASNPQSAIQNLLGSLTGGSSDSHGAIEDELSKTLSAASSSSLQLDASNSPMIAKTREPFSSDPSSGMVLFKQKQWSASQLDSSASSGPSSDIVGRSEFGPHAEPSELEHQIASNSVLLNMNNQLHLAPNQTHPKLNDKYELVVQQNNGTQLENLNEPQMKQQANSSVDGPPPISRKQPARTNKMRPHKGSKFKPGVYLLNDTMLTPPPQQQQRAHKMITYISKAVPNAWTPPVPYQPAGSSNNILSPHPDVKFIGGLPYDRLGFGSLLSGGASLADLDEIRSLVKIGSTQQQQTEPADLPYEFSKYYLNSNSGQVFSSQPSSSSGESSAATSRGPFELEQLQATPGNPRNEKIHQLYTTSTRHSNDDSTASESNKLETNPELTPPTGPSPAISDQLQDESGNSQPASDANSPDYEPLDDFGSPGDDLEGTKVAALARLPQDHQQAAAMRDMGSSSDLSTARQHVLYENSESASKSPAKANETQANVAAASEATSARALTKQGPVKSKQLNSMSNDGNELLVGPFKSEADAPATITLAGVVYQKSGASSALIRSAGQLRLKSPIGVPATSMAQLQQQQQLPKSEGDRISTSGSAVSSSTNQQAAGLQAMNQQQLAALGDWPSNSMLHNFFLQSSQPSIYLGTMATGDINSNNHQDLISSTNSNGAPNIIRFSSPFQPAALSSISSNLAAAYSPSPAVGQSIVGGSGDALSLSSSNSKLKSIAMTWKDANNEHLQQQDSSLAGHQGTPLYQQRLPDGSIIWTLNKPSLQGLIQSAAPSSEPSTLTSSSTLEEGGEMSAAQLVGQLAAGESKQHNHKQGGPIVIVQKDVKPVKYHLLRAYLKLRRLLRPFEATYVFPSQPTGAASTANSVLTSSSAAGRSYLRRQHPAAASLSLMGGDWRHRRRRRRRLHGARAGRAFGYYSPPALGRLGKLGR